MEQITYVDEQGGENTTENIKWTGWDDVTCQWQWTASRKEKRRRWKERSHA